MKRTATRIAMAFSAVAMFVGSAWAADITLTEDTEWLDGRALSGTIDLNGHKLTVSSLTGNATITSPTGYEILEYIDSDSKAYVDTGVKAANNTVLDIKFRMLQDSGGSYVSYAGARPQNGADGQFAGYIQSLMFYWCVSKGEGFNGTIAVDTDYTVHLDKNGPCKIGETTYATGSGVGNASTIFVFGANQKGGVAGRGYFRVYSCRIAYGDDLQCDLKPARRLSDGALGLLDVKDPENLAFKENKDSSGAFTAGPVVSDEFVKRSGELHVKVESGSTENSQVAITESVRVVKEGAGTFIATKQGQTYIGGTDVTAGTFRCGNGGHLNIYGAAGSTVTVREGATFDCDGWADHAQFRFVLDGGTIKCANPRYPVYEGSWFADVTLTTNSFMTGDHFGFVGAGWAESVLRMNGHKLTLSVTSGSEVYMCNLKVEGGGEIYGKSGGYLSIGGNSVGSGKYVKAETTTLRMGGLCIRDRGGEYVFGSYISEHTGGWWRGVPSAFKVLDRFVPGTEWHKTELQDGATLDLSACTGAWNVSCTPANSEGRTFTATFAKGATIFVDLGDRKVKSSDPIVTWAAKPENVKFLALPGTKGKFTAREDGLYWNVGFSVIVH